jgi:hypothetical protein
MTIWLLALVLLASLAGLGYRQGAIRVACSLVGILAGVLLAVPLAKLTRVRAGLELVGVHHPVLLWLLPPFVVFCVVLILFKAAGWEVNRRVGLYYKYKSEGARPGLWERMQRRLGLCLGLVNGTVYLALISTVIYAFSYWTVQVAASDQESKAVRLLNRMGWDLQGTGMAKVARAIDPMPEIYYEAADLANVIYHTPLIEARLARYPGFFSLAERPDFQALAQDKTFTQMRLTQQPIRTVLAHPTAAAIWKNPDTLNLVWDTVAPDLKDLRAFLGTFKSEKYDGEKIVGRWSFDVNSAIAAVRQAKQNITSREMQTYKRLFESAYAKVSMVAMPDNQVLLKNLPGSGPQAGAASAGAAPVVRGQWRKDAQGQYELTLTAGGAASDVKAQVDGDRMTVGSQEMPLAFTREY